MCDGGVCNERVYYERGCAMTNLVESFDLHE